MRSKSIPQTSFAGQRSRRQNFDATAPQILLGWFLSSLLLLLLKGRMLADPYFWDELGCYFSQVYEMSHRLVPYLASKPVYVRAPLLTTLLALLHHYVSESPVLLRATVLVIGALVIPATYALTCQLGGSRRLGILGGVLAGLLPAVFAQLGLIQMDLPATGLCALAFVSLLRRNMVGYAILGGLAVLIKESTYWVCLPAALLVYARLVLREQRRPLAPGTLLRLWPTAIPGVVLFLWLLVHRRITGAMVSSDHTAVIGLDGIFPSLLHNLIEGGRLPLSMAATAYLVSVYRTYRQQRDHQTRQARPSEAQLAIAATAVWWLSLPLCFPGQLVRYLLPSVPALCALAALGVGLLPSTRRLGMAALLCLFLVSGLRSDSFHNNSPFELEGNLSYRRLLQEHVMVAQRIADSGARSAIADFPFSSILGMPPHFGYLDKPLAVTILDRLHEPSELCRAEVVVVTEVSAASFPLIEKAKQLGILRLWFVAAGADFPIGKGLFTPRWARYDHTISVYRASCPAP